MKATNRIAARSCRNRCADVGLWRRLGPAGRSRRVFCCPAAMARSATEVIPFDDWQGYLRPYLEPTCMTVFSNATEHRDSVRLSYFRTILDTSTET